MAESDELDRHLLKLLMDRPRLTPSDDDMDRNWEWTMALCRLESKGFADVGPIETKITDKGREYFEKIWDEEQDWWETN